MQYAGGILLTPVQTLVATLINESHYPPQKRESHPDRGGFFFFLLVKNGIRTSEMQYAGGILLTPVQTLVATLIDESHYPPHKKGRLQGYRVHHLYEKNALGGGDQSPPPWLVLPVRTKDYAGSFYLVVLFEFSNNLPIIYYSGWVAVTVQVPLPLSVMILQAFPFISV